MKRLNMKRIGVISVVLVVALSIVLFVFKMSVATKDSRAYDDKGLLKKYFDESFLLDYLASRTIHDSQDKKLNMEEISERLIGNVVEKLIDINAGITEEQLSNLVARQYTIIKYRNVVTDKKIRKIYRDAIDKYLKKVSGLDME